MGPVTYTSSVNDPTLVQQNAVKMAKSYLDEIYISRSLLIKQLGDKGFSNEDAIYAVDQLNVDWKQQAVKLAEMYLDEGYFYFSRAVSMCSSSRSFIGVLCSTQLE